MALAASEEAEDEEELLSGEAGEGRRLGLPNSSFEVEGLGPPPAPPPGLLLYAIADRFRCRNYVRLRKRCCCCCHRRAESWESSTAVSVVAAPPLRRDADSITGLQFRKL